MNLQQQGLMSSLIVLNVWCPLQRQRTIFSFYLLHVVRTASYFLYHLCGSSANSVFASIVPSIILQCFILSLLSVRWTNSQRHIQEQVMLMSHFIFSWIWWISSTKNKSIYWWDVFRQDTKQISEATQLLLKSMKTCECTRRVSSLPRVTRIKQ